MSGARFGRQSLAPAAPSVSLDCDSGSPETRGGGGGCIAAASVLEMASDLSSGSEKIAPLAVKPETSGTRAVPTRFGRPCVAG